MDLGTGLQMVAAAELGMAALLSLLGMAALLSLVGMAVLLSLVGMALARLAGRLARLRVRVARVRELRVLPGRARHQPLQPAGRALLHPLQPVRVACKA